MRNIIKKKLHVIGDIMLDKWIYGIIERKNPESSACLINAKQTYYNLGGAANVALNLSNLSSFVSLYGSIGKDEQGKKILNLLSKTKIKNCTITKKHTVQKTRVVDQLSNKHLLRYDNDFINKITNDHKNILKKIRSNDIVIISDYNKGNINSSLIKKIISKTKNVIVDPKQNPKIYKNCFLVKPNMKEFLEWTNLNKFNWNVADELLKKMNWKWLVITDGSNGVYVLNSKEKKFFKSNLSNVIDVSGSGDIVICYLAYSMYIKKNLFFSTMKASKIATYYTQSPGVSVINKKDIKKFSEVVFTNGCFDILHEGHIKLLKFAKSLGDKLIIGINSDKSVRKNKGSSRPINKQILRKQNLKKLKLADEIIIFKEITPLNLIKRIKPNIIVKGSDYKKSEVVGKNIAKIEIFPKYKNLSSTKLIK